MLSQRDDSFKHICRLSLSLGCVYTAVEQQRLVERDSVGHRLEHGFPIYICGSPNSHSLWLCPPITNGFLNV